MGVLVGPTPWWQSNLVRFCAVGCPLPDGSRIICKAAGTAWIVAPACTQVSSAWIGGQYPGVCVTTTYPGRDFSQVCEWSTLQSCLISSGFNPSDWFVPSFTQLSNPGYTCKDKWDTYLINCYVSSTENSAANANYIRFDGFFGAGGKTAGWIVRAMRCVTY